MFGSWRVGWRCVLLWLVPVAAAAQEEYVPYRPAEERFDERFGEPMLQTDTSLFYRAVQLAPDLFARQTEHAFSFVAWRRRGAEHALASIRCYGVPVSWRYVAALRLAGAVEERRGGLKSAPGAIGLTGGVADWRFPDFPQPAHRVAVGLTGRNYLAALRIVSCGRLGRSWSYAAALDARTGRDLHIEGVFTHALTATLSAMRQVGDGTLRLTAVVPLSMRGLRSSATAEAFALTGDELYNPGWGFQNGHVRNARVRREVLPLVLATFEYPVAPSARLELSAAAECGTSRLSGLAWFDARTPLPDNYRCMPSYDGSAETEAVWRAADPRYVQIDWNELYARNRLAGGEAVYALEERVERRTHLRMRGLLTTEIGARTTLRCGLHAAVERSRFFKVARDLLGAGYLVDRDYFLVDDDSFGNRLQNDLRHPDRRVCRGDRFGYDYALVHEAAGVELQAEYRADCFRCDLGGELTQRRLYRRGYCEKELFPGAASFGRSPELCFTTYTCKAAAGYAFTPRSYLEAVVLTAAVAPGADDLFLQPQYNNRAVADPALRRIHAVECSFSHTGRQVVWQVTGFATLSSDAVHVRRYYDDLAGVYANMVASEIRTRAVGAEAAVEVRLTPAWRIDGAVTAGCYDYAGDPLVRVYADADNAVIDAGSRSAMGDCRPGGAPQLAAVAGVSWFSRSGSGLRMSVACVSGRYVEPSLLRRTPRVARQAAVSPERFEAFTAQERLADGWTADLSLFRSFAWAAGRLTAALMVRNMLNDRRTCYDGSESLRIRRARSGDTYIYSPFDSRYTHVYPRSFYLSVSWKF